MSRRNRQAAFSLFSFQDIVTSVTAILILVVLILSLELLERTQSAAAASSGVTRAGLVETIAGLEQLAAVLEATVPGEAGLAALAVKTASELERETRIVEAQAERAVAEASASKEVERRAAALAAVALAQLFARQGMVGRIEALQEQAADADAEARRRALENEKERDRLAKRQQEIVQQPKAGTQLVFNVPPQSAKQPWLVEVAADGVATVRLGSNERRALGAAKGVESAVGAWVRTLQPASDYALILVRPSGIDSYEDVRKLLEAQGIDIGIDFIGEDQAVRDGSGEKSDAASGGG